MNLKEQTVSNLIALGKSEIEAYRIVLNLTSQELADKLGITKQSISQFETNKRATPQRVLDLLHELIQK